MIRTIFPFAMFLQGLIHLLGFVKEWELAQVKQLTGETLHTISLLGGLSKIIGILWLIACLLFILSAGNIFVLLRKE